ncbi:MAG: M15 family metallopeptidase [Hydrogenibacillus sp.]|nr:M15 family metallopeptidase [Hydrogenibacillus sp.]
MKSNTVAVTWGALALLVAVLAACQGGPPTDDGRAPFHAAVTDSENSRPVDASGRHVTDVGGKTTGGGAAGSRSADRQSAESDAERPGERRAGEDRTGEGATDASYALPAASSAEKGETVVDDPLSILVLVNKHRVLPTGFRPPDLVPADIPFDKPEGDERRLLREPAARAIEALFAAAKQDGIELIGVSGFRSYELQQSIFDSNVRAKGKAEALRVSAPPGTSEHQTGLAIDVADASKRCLLEPCFGDTPAGRWLAAHAAEFGFIIRYPEGAEPVTGYAYEPWHLRYVGKEAAQEIAAREETLEAYLETREDHAAQAQGIGP